MNYKQTNLAGTSWVRCKSISITNPLPGGTEVSYDSITKRQILTPIVPTAYFQEEKVISIDDVQNTIDIGICTKKFNPTDIINLRNPETGGLVGTTATHGDLYVLLYSLYLQTAEERDATAT